jgi:hypothetical protein
VPGRGRLYPFVKHFADRDQYRAHFSRYVPLRKWMVFLQDLIQVLAFDVGHGDELHAAGFGQVVDAQNVCGKYGWRATTRFANLAPEPELSCTV